VVVKCGELDREVIAVIRRGARLAEIKVEQKPIFAEELKGLVGGCLNAPKIAKTRQLVASRPAGEWMLH
jgi:hypothetical protein